MARSDRLFRLLHALRTLPAPVTAARLAEETEVSERTLYRDIDALRAAGARIEGEAGVGYTMTEDIALPPQTFDRLEIEALVIGLGEIAALGDADLAAAARSALTKISATLPDRQQRQITHAVSMVQRYRDAPATPVDLSLVRTALWDERELAFAYVDNAGRVSRRSVKPLALVYIESTLLLLAWCNLRNDFRRFHAWRLREVEVLATSFRPHRASLLRDYVAILSGRNRPESPS